MRVRVALVSAFSSCRSLTGFCSGLFASLVVRGRMLGRFFDDVNEWFAFLAFFEERSPGPGLSLFLLASELFKCFDRCGNGALDRRFSIFGAFALSCYRRFERDEQPQRYNENGKNNENDDCGRIDTVQDGQKETGRR